MFRRVHIVGIDDNMVHAEQKDATDHGFLTKLSRDAAQDGNIWPGFLAMSRSAEALVRREKGAILSCDLRLSCWLYAPLFSRRQKV